MDKSQRLFGSCTITIARTPCLCLTITATRIVNTEIHGVSNVGLGLFGLAAVCDDERTLCLASSPHHISCNEILWRDHLKTDTPSKKPLPSQVHNFPCLAVDATGPALSVAAAASWSSSWNCSCQAMHAPIRYLRTGSSWWWSHTAIFCIYPESIESDTAVVSEEKKQLSSRRMI